MRPVSEFWVPTLIRSHRVVAYAEAWLDGHRIAARIPITGGTITYDDTATLRRRISCEVPAFDQVTGTWWDPSADPASPLAIYGQRLRVFAGVELPFGGTEVMTQGWYMVTSWQLDETAGTIAVDGVDLAQLLADARHYTILTPTPGATVVQEFGRMCDGILPVAVAPGILDRPINPATVYDRDRIKNLTDLARSIGARWYVDDGAAVRLTPDYAPVGPDTPVTVALHSGAGGRVVSRARSGTRERLYNAVVVTGKAADDGGATPYGVAEVTDPRSPIRVGGPYGSKPKFYASDQLVTDDQCAQVAAAMLPGATSVSRSEPVSALPDPAVELGDVAEVLTGGLPWRGRITALTLPLGPDAMTVTVSNAPRDPEEESR